MRRETSRARTRSPTAGAGSSRTPTPASCGHSAPWAATAPVSPRWSTACSAAAEPFGHRGTHATGGVGHRPLATEALHERHALDATARHVDAVEHLTRDDE